MKVTGKVLVPFSYKGTQYQKDDEVSMPPGHAARYEKLDYIKLTREEEKKVEAAQEKSELKAPKTKN